MCRRASKRARHQGSQPSCARSSRRSHGVRTRDIADDRLTGRCSASAIPTRAATTARTAAASCPRRWSRRSRSSSAAYFAARARPGVRRPSSARLLRDYVGRPTPLYEATRADASRSAARASSSSARTSRTPARTRSTTRSARRCSPQRMGKRRIIAETGAGQHGVATATVCALLGLECDVYMGAEDMARQALNVFRMQLLGATVRRVDAGSRTLKDAINEAMRDWVTNVDRQLLPARLGARPASVSADGARVPVGDRPGGARAVPRRRSAGCPTRSSPASAAAATRWASSTRSSTTATCG